MKVLISAASKHGATAEIADAIGEVLSATGIEVDVCQPEDVTTVAPYDGVVLGSAVYAGRWLEPVKKLIERESDALLLKPVWLFSSGPLGDPAKPTTDPVDITRLRAATHAIDHQLFPGKIDRYQLGMAERAILAVVRVPDGDFRPWEAVQAWASSIAATLQAKPVEVAAR